MKEVRDFCGKLILESAKVVCSCTILCLNSKTVTALGEIYGTGFLDRGSTPLISTIAHRYEPEMLIFGDVFVLTYKTAEV